MKIMVIEEKVKRVGFYNWRFSNATGSERAKLVDEKFRPFLIEYLAEIYRATQADIFHYFCISHHNIEGRKMVRRLLKYMLLKDSEHPVSLIGNSYILNYEFRKKNYAVIQKQLSKE